MLKKFFIGWYESKMSHNSLRITNAFFFTNLMKLQKLDLVREESSLNWIEFFPNLTVIKGRLREIKLCQGSSEGTTWKILRTSWRISGYDRILFEKKSHAWINPSWIVHYKRRFTVYFVLFKVISNDYQHCNGRRVRYRVFRGFSLWRETNNSVPFFDSVMRLTGNQATAVSEWCWGRAVKLCASWKLILYTPVGRVMCTSSVWRGAPITRRYNIYRYSDT